jgi:hypothetical protein
MIDSSFLFILETYRIWGACFSVVAIAAAAAVSLFLLL